MPVSWPSSSKRQADATDNLVEGERAAPDHVMDFHSEGPMTRCPERGSRADVGSPYASRRKETDVQAAHQKRKCAFVRGREAVTGAERQLRCNAFSTHVPSSIAPKIQRLR